MRLKTSRLNPLPLLLAILIPASLISAAPIDPRNVNPVEVGSALPEATLTSASGKELSLKEVTGGQKSVIIFYRGSWCPYCTRHLAAIGKHEQAILDKGYKIIAISPDKVEKIREYNERTELNYTLYSDSDMSAASAFGLTFEVDAATLKKLNSYDIDLEDASGKSHHLLPVPAVFITDDSGRITFRYFDPDYTKRLAPDALLDAIR